MPLISDLCLVVRLTFVFVSILFYKRALSFFQINLETDVFLSLRSSVFAIASSPLSPLVLVRHCNCPMSVQCPQYSGHWLVLTVTSMIKAKQFVDCGFRSRHHLQISAKMQSAASRFCLYHFPVSARYQKSYREMMPRLFSVLSVCSQV